ncbi:MAG: DUF1638 domain-containing protein [bacterium]|nr:DUF1638 domain-containing protein [bacterium]
MKIKFICCEIFYREACTVISRSPNLIDVEFLPKRLHDLGGVKMAERLRQVIDAVDESAYDAIVLGYGLCNNGTLGLQARTIPLVIPRAHDCITVFLGGRKRYQDYFEENPGVYFKTTGWIERGEMAGGLSQFPLPDQLGLGASYEELVKKYGEENAQYLYDKIGDLTPHYRKCAFIEMGIEPNREFEDIARQCAIQHGWVFEKLEGDLSLMQALVDGEWINDDRFCVARPGQRLAAEYQGDIFQLEESSS